MTGSDDWDEAEHLIRFWDEKVKWAEAGDQTPDGRQTLRVDGVHYVVGHEELGHNEPQFRGFGGRKMVFELFDGTLIESTNIWCQGDIPTVYRDRLPDNARFVPQKITPTFKFE